MSLTGNTCPTTPTDIIATVLDHLVFNFDRKGRAELTTCRLVSREWDSVARPLCFKTLSVTLTPCKRKPKHMHHLLDFLHEHQAIAQHVQSLSLQNNCWVMGDRVARSFYCAFPVTIEDLRQLMDAVPNLQNLRLCSVCPEGPDPDSVPLEHLADVHSESPELARDTLRRLTFIVPFGTPGYDPTSLSKVLGMFASIRELRVYCSRDDDRGEGWASAHISSEPNSSPIRSSLADRLVIGSMQDEAPLRDSTLHIWFRGVRVLTLGFMSFAVKRTSLLNKLLRHFASLEVLHMQNFSKDLLRRSEGEEQR